MFATGHDRFDKGSGAQTKFAVFHAKFDGQTTFANGNAVASRQPSGNTDHNNATKGQRSNATLGQFRARGTGDATRTVVRNALQALIKQPLSSKCRMVWAGVHKSGCHGADLSKMDT